MLLNDTYEIKSKQQEDLIEKYIPLDKNSKYDQCHIKSYDTNFTSNFTNYTIIKCNSWVYSKAYYDETIVTRVC
jgi:hypothetical protein